MNKGIEAQFRRKVEELVAGLDTLLFGTEDELHPMSETWSRRLGDCETGHLHS